MVHKIIALLLAQGARRDSNRLRPSLDGRVLCFVTVKGVCITIHPLKTAAMAVKKVSVHTRAAKTTVRFTINITAVMVVLVKGKVCQIYVVV